MFDDESQCRSKEKKLSWTEFHSKKCSQLGQHSEDLGHRSVFKVWSDSGHQILLLRFTRQEISKGFNVFWCLAWISLKKRLNWDKYQNPRCIWLQDKSICYTYVCEFISMITLQEVTTNTGLWKNLAYFEFVLESEQLKLMGSKCQSNFLWVVNIVGSG